MYVFRVTNTTPPETFRYKIDRLKEGKVKSIILNSQNQIEITQSIDLSYNVYVVEDSSLKPSSTTKFQQGSMPLPITILSNTHIFNNLLSQYKTNNCDGIMMSHHFPIETMVASEIAHTLYPSFFPSYKYMPSGHLCRTFSDESYIPIDECPNDHIIGLEEVYATSVLLGITLQPSIYSCWQRNQEVINRIDSLGMAFTWFASTHLSMPTNDLDIYYLGETFKYKQRTCGSIVNTICDTDRLIDAYRHVVDLNQTVIEDYIDTLTCVSQTYDCDDVLTNECEFHNPYSIVSHNIRVMINANRKVILNVLDQYDTCPVGLEATTLI